MILLTSSFVFLPDLFFTLCDGVCALVVIYSASQGYRERRFVDIILRLVLSYLNTLTHIYFDFWFLLFHCCDRMPK